MIARYWFAMVSLAALVVVSAAPEASGGGGVPISSCAQTVTSSAYLTQDLGCAGLGIAVNATGQSGLTIDLKGFRIFGSHNNYGILVTGGTKTTIKNGLVRNFEVGIHAPEDGTVVSNLVVSGNLQDGI